MQCVMHGYVCIQKNVIKNLLLMKMIVLFLQLMKLIILPNFTFKLDELRSNPYYSFLVSEEVVI